MLALKTAPATRVRNNFREYCDQVIENQEALIVSRANNQDVVILGLAEYNALLNRLYLDKLKNSLEELEQGDIVMTTMEELRALE